MGTLTVVIPAFNAEATVGDAVRSAIEANASRVIVVDDGSSDRTGQIAISAGAEVIIQTNAGASEARANGAQRVDSDYVVFLDADDALIRDGVVQSVSVLNDDPDIDVAAGRIVGFVGTSDEALQPPTYDSFTTVDLLTEGYGPWPPGAGVIRTTTLRAAERATPAALRPRYAEDYELLIRLSLVGKIVRHEQPALRYEMGGGKSSRSVEASMRAMNSKESIRRYYAVSLGVPLTLTPASRLRAAAHKRVARGLALGNARPAALRHMLLANIYGAISLFSRRERVGIAQQ